MAANALTARMFSNAAMQQVFSPENTIQRMLDFEAALAGNAPEVEESTETPVALLEPETEPSADLVVEENEENDENAEFRRALRTQPGEWFVIHSYAGYEKKVKTNLESRIHTLNMEDFIFQVEVPEEEITEIKNGQRKQVKRNVFPGYVLVRMDLTDESWSCVRNTPGVTGFVGNAHHPSPLTLSEVENILAPRPAKGGCSRDQDG